MELHAKLVRSQLSFFKPFVAGLSLEVTRKGQDKLGELMTALHRREVLVHCRQDLGLEAVAYARVNGIVHQRVIAPRLIPADLPHHG